MDIVTIGFYLFAAVTIGSVWMASRHYWQSVAYYHERERSKAMQFALARRYGEILAELKEEGHVEASTIAQSLLKTSGPRLTELANYYMKETS